MESFTDFNVIEGMAVEFKCRTGIFMISVNWLTFNGIFMIYGFYRVRIFVLYDGTFNFINVIV